MGYPPEHRERTRERILESAGRLFRARGYDAASIDDIMEGADLTRGGFYAHFRSKDDLFAAYVGRELAFAHQLRRGRDDAGAEGAREAVRYYLEPGNRTRIGRGCTIVANAADVARGSARARGAFTRAFEDLRGEFRSLASGRDAEARALSALATCVGGVVLARALADRELVGELLAACREAVEDDLGVAGEEA